MNSFTDYGTETSPAEFLIYKHHAPHPAPQPTAAASDAPLQYRKDSPPDRPLITPRQVHHGGPRIIVPALRSKQQPAPSFTVPYSFNVVHLKQ